MMLRAFREGLGVSPTLDRVPISEGKIALLMSSIGLSDTLALSTEDLENIVSIRQLDEQQVAEYLRAEEPAILRKTGLNTTEFRDSLYRIYDLEDLMRRPLLLKMIVKTVLSAGVDLRARDLKFGQPFCMRCTHKCPPSATFGEIPLSSFSPTRSVLAPADRLRGSCAEAEGPI
jgi:hypothetical protein